VVLLASTGGNGKTSDNVVSLCIVPLEVFDAVRAEGDATERNRAYQRGIRAHIGAACGKCMFAAWEHAGRKAQGLKRCYAQHNFQTASQAVAIVASAVGPLPGWGVFDAEGWGFILESATYMGIDTIRSAVVGDMGMLPVGVATTLIAAAPTLKWLGYTHQWFRSEHLKATHQASTQGPWKAAFAAEARGWGVYHIVSQANEEMPARYSLCPAQAGKLTGWTVRCTGCLIPCDGAGGNLTGAIDHGPGANFKKSPAARAYVARMG
jgi:hypothetical protein